MKLNRKFTNDHDAEVYANQLRQQGHTVSITWHPKGIVWVKVTKPW